MNNLNFCIAGLLCGLACAQSRASVQAGKSASIPDPSQHLLTIRIHNLSSADRQDIVDLKNAATAVFEHARIKVAWIDCVSSGSSAACEAPRQTGATIDLLVINDQARTGYHAIGWTTLGTYLATIHYRRAERMARASTLNVSCGQILGNTAAHEIGQLLLGSANHALFGIMKPTYDPRDLLAMTQGRLYYSKEDAERIRARLLASAH